MAKRDTKYDQVYQTLRKVASESIREFKGNPDGGIVVAGAQAEAFVRTLKGYTLRLIKKKYHAQYLHRLFTQMLCDVLEDLPHLSGRIAVAERPKARKH